MTWFHFDLPSFATSFLSVLFESVPFLLLGALFSGLIEVFVPARWMTGMLPKRPVYAILISGLLGCVFPMCECGVVPVIRRLLKKGLPVSCAVTYLLASPVVNPIVAASTYAAFRGNQPGTTTVYRLVLSYLVAALVGLIVQRLRAEQFLNARVLASLPGSSTRRTAGFRVGSRAGAGGSTAGAAVSPFTLEGTEGGAAALETLDTLAAGMQQSFPRRLLAALQRGANDFLDVAVFVVIGAALAAVFNTAVLQSVILPLATNPWAATTSLMAFAFVLAVCSSSDAFIAAAFTAFPFPARLAFLVFGPVFDLKLVFLYSLVFRRRFVLWLGVGLFVLIALICVKLSELHFSAFNPMKTLSRGLSALALLAWGGLMLYFFHSKRLDAYVIPFYRPLVAASGYAMLGIAASLLYTLRYGAGWQLAGGMIADDAADELSSPGRVRTMQILAFAMLVLPIWAAASVSGDGFSASTVRNRGIVSDASQLPGAAKPSAALAASAATAPAGSATYEPPLPGETPAPADAGSVGTDVSQYMKTTEEGHIVAEVPDLLFSAEDNSMRAGLAGRTVEVIGQYLPVKDSTNGRFQIVRMFMVCCAADARPVAVVAEKAPGSPNVAEMGWARAVGKITFPVEDGRRVPILQTEKLTPCDPPAEAMLY